MSKVYREFHSLSRRKCCPQIEYVNHDTLQIVKKLKEAGFTEAQAEGQVEVTLLKK